MEPISRGLINLKPLAPADINSRVRAALSPFVKEGRTQPNIYLAMANTPAVLETYLMGIERFRTDSNFTSQEQEVVFLTITVDCGC